MKKLAERLTPAQKYAKFIAGIDDDISAMSIELRNDRAALAARIDGHFRLRSDQWTNGGPSTLSNHIKCVEILHAKFVICAKAHRSYLPLVRAGLMSVAQCVHEVSLGHTARPTDELPFLDLR